MPGAADTIIPVPEGSASGLLFRGISSTTRPLRQSPECRTVRRKKKLSRKYQRFLERKALLERRGLLKRRRVKEKEGPRDHPQCSGGCSFRQESTKQPSGSCVNGNFSILSGALQTLPKTESIKLLKSRKSGPPVRRATPLTPEGLDRPPPAAVPRRARLGGFCCSATKCVAIDCEMVGTGACGWLGEVARCSIVDYQGGVIYDKYVKPEGPITDYRTRWSGIRKQHMASAIEFNVAQREIMKILKGKIVIGHALHNDFKALKYFHPRSLTRDTSKMPLLKKVAGFPERESVSLKNLAKQLLHKSIQVGRDGHCSVEDACTAMQLYQLVEVHWEQKLHSELSTEHDHTTSDAGSEISHYMDDRYWPAELQECSK
ncbi:apoptosis-enhancing nuclease-like [Pristis pectinata]|uniref:apoptosis-enhancing nuclease-like n=1 Tax=Pristis pectinata TaxID=685728 RepID=UPI00223E1B2B|nr:apoptosis-enhancing nuclease-like [Pristis pectinata]